MEKENSAKKELTEVQKDRISHFKEVGFRLKELRNQEPDEKVKYYLG